MSEELEEDKRIIDYVQTIENKPKESRSIDEGIILYFYHKTNYFKKLLEVREGRMNEYMNI